MNKLKKEECDCLLETNTLMSCLEIGKLLTSTYNLKEILDLIMLRVSQLIPAQNWSILLKDQSTGELSFEVVVGIDKELVENVRIPLGEGVAGRVAKTGEALFLEDVEDDSIIDREVDKKTGFVTKSIICLPLKIHDKILGVIEVVNVENFEKFESKDLPALQILADYAAIGIENSQYFEKIRQLSITDEYTGLYNARYLHSVLEGLIKKSAENNEKLAVVFVDIDNFKDVVDTHGHLSGSKVLKEIGEKIMEYLDKDDTLIKYGGDEYVLMFPQSDKNDAAKKVKKILDSIRKSTFLNSESLSIKVTASFGVAIYPDDAKTKKELLLAADNLMYKVKESTKNDIGLT